MKYCIKNSGGNSFTFTSGGGVTYELKANNGSAAYVVTNDSSPVASTLSPAPTTGWKQITAGASHTCAIGLDDLAYCWGYNNKGQLGNNSFINSSVPIAVNKSGVLNGKTIKSIIAGHYHTCAIASDNQSYCWGQNTSGELGNNSTVNSGIPVPVTTSGVLNGKTASSLAAGSEHSCVISSDGRVYCWGLNNQGQLGDNSTTNSSVPIPVVVSGAFSGKTIKTITAGSNHNCAIASDDKVYCWGYNNYGELGINSITDSHVPVAVNTSGVLNGKTIKSVATGRQLSTCVIASDNQAYCWGYNAKGQLGDGSTTDSLIPIAVYTSGVLASKTLRQITMGEWHTCTTTSDNGIYCWGWNNYGQNGNNSTAQSTVPVSVNMSGVLNGKTISSIGAGSNFTCTIAIDNQSYCWGRNAAGQLGNNSITDSIVPIATQLPQ